MPDGFVALGYSTSTMAMCVQYGQGDLWLVRAGANGSNSLGAKLWRERKDAPATVLQTPDRELSLFGYLFKRW